MLCCAGREIAYLCCSKEAGGNHVASDFGKTRVYESDITCMPSQRSFDFKFLFLIITSTDLITESFVSGNF